MGVTKELTHESAFGRKSIRLGSTVPQPIDVYCHVPLHALVLN